MSKPAALQQQIGGGHYKGMAIQPMEFSMANNWDACAHTILKYVTRHQDKNGRQDLEKAQHCVALRQELWHARHEPADVIGTGFYCEENNLGAEETAVIIALSGWVWSNSERARMQLQVALQHLISVTYDQPQEQLAFSTNS